MFGERFTAAVFSDLRLLAPRKARWGRYEERRSQALRSPKVLVISAPHTDPYTGHGRRASSLKRDAT